MTSVCVATYNGERYIRQQLESILCQLGDDDEVIVSDDGSSDGTADVVEAIGDSRIRLLHHPAPHGVNANFGYALSHARGEYIFLADQDDVWLPGKVDKCIAALADHVCVMHDCRITDSSLNPTGETLLRQLGAKTGFWANLMRNRYTGCCMAFRSSLMRRILPIPQSRLFYHDNWIGLNAALCGSVAFLPFEGLLFRRHEASGSSAAGKSRLSLTQKIMSRAALLWHICLRLTRK